MTPQDYQPSKAIERCLALDAFSICAATLLIPRQLSISNPGTVAYRRGVGGLPPSNRRAKGAVSKSCVSYRFRRKQTLGLVRA